MENNLEQRINERIQKGMSFDFDTFFAAAWKIFKKVTLMIAGAVFMLVIPILIVYAVMMPFLLGIGSIEQYMEIVKNDPYYFQAMQRHPMFILKQSLMTIIIALISAPIQAGMIKICRDADKNEEIRFGTIFSYYKAPYFGKLVATILITTLASSALNIAFSFIPFVGNFIYLILVLIGYVMISFVQPLIIFSNASLGQAFSLSFKLASKSFWPVIGYSLLFGILCFLGVIACCIGIFFTVAFIPTCHYLLYKHAVGFPEDEVGETEQGHWQDQPQAPVN